MVCGDSGDKTDEWMRLLQPYRSPRRDERYSFSPELSALLVVDMQRYFLDKASHAYLPMGSAILDNVKQIAASFRRIGRPLMFTKHALLDDEPAGVMDKWWNDSLRLGDPMSEIVDELTPEENDDVIRKTRYSAFVGTDLDSKLRSAKAGSIVITGVMTHLCCESTARDAFMRDYDVYIVVDGTASSDEELHVSSLRTLTDGFAMPITAEEVLGWLGA
ncbi:MAG: cysteine hydrolase [Methanobacteriota archaeon]|nr:MAG: cysteine hydrolase [Euryarchaeota archaeon]